MVVALMRTNITQEFAGAVFGVGQPTVSRRWDLLRPAIGEAPAEVVPDPKEVTGSGSVLGMARSVPRGTGGASRICSPARPATPG